MTFVCSDLGQGMTGCSGECCFGVMYGEWYVLTMVVSMCFMFVLILASSMVFVYVCVVCFCFLRLGVVYCDVV